MTLSIHLSTQLYLNCSIDAGAAKMASKDVNGPQEGTTSRRVCYVRCTEVIFHG